MPPAPVLLDVSQRSAHRGSSETFKRWLFQHTGGVSNLSEFPECDDLRDEEPLRQWLRTLAGDLWLARQESTSSVNDAVWKALLDSGICLWEDGPPLMALHGARAAVALVPLDTGTPTGDAAGGGLIRLWMMILDQADQVSQDHRQLLCGGPNFMNELNNEKFRIFIDPLQDIAGRSWQLAASLLVWTLNKRDHQAARVLARDWFCTGVLGPEQRIDKMRLGGKLSLIRGAEHRAWMMPLEAWSNDEDILRRRISQRLALVDNLSTAWNILKGNRTAADEVRHWPAGGIMHAFVSGSLRPLLLGVLLARPSKLVLWVSKKMLEQNRHTMVINVLEIWQAPDRGLDKMDIEVCHIESTDVRKAEQMLLTHPDLADTGGQKLINVTGGNLLMRFALTSIAQINPSLTLVYRDVDAADPEIDRQVQAQRFITLRYEYRQGLTGAFESCNPYPESQADYVGLTNEARPEDDSIPALKKFFKAKL